MSFLKKSRFDWPARLPSLWIRQGCQFTFIGLLQLLLDSSVFVGTTAFGLNPILGNIAGRICGAILGFWLNGRFTFANRDGPRLGLRRLCRFLLCWLVLTGISSWAMRTIAYRSGIHQAWLSKPIIEGTLALLSFVLGRYVIYR